MIFNLRGLEQTILRDATLSRMLGNVFVSQSFLFAGCSLDTIETLFRAMRVSGGESPHFALVGMDNPGVEARADILAKYYGLRVIPYRTPEEFVEILRKLRGPEPSGHSVIQSATTPPGGSRITRAVFTNIGPFERLELDFNSGWNILLGNNGVGKSSILKALAIALSGTAATQWADRVIRAGQPSGEISLEIDHQTFQTTLLRFPGGSSGAEIRQIPRRPLEETLVIGFPPLRTGTWGSVSAGLDSRNIPVPDDIIPLVKGEADPRLDKLKQWIVNVDYRIKDALSRQQDPSHFRSMLDDFFHVVGELTDGVPLKFGSVDPQTRQVTVITADGPVPMEMISQGTASLVSWIGVLLQRLYEVFGAKDPRSQHAIVLIDEIDAHMHPGWQQLLVHHLQKMFPNLQVIATTHSPLIVAGRTREEVLVFERDPSTQAVSVKRPEMDFVNLRADQILTSPAFRLDAARDYVAKEKLNRYRQLLGQAEPLTAERQAELRELRSDPAISGRDVSDTVAAGKAAELVSDALDEKFAAMPLEEKKRMKDEIDAQMRAAMLEGGPMR